MFYLFVRGVYYDYCFIMSILNEDSSSLVIAEQQEQIEISEVESDRGGEEELFELSRDDPTLSFRIEEEKRQLAVVEIVEIESQFSSKIAVSPQALAENKKRRKDIFEKFKKPQSSITSKFDNLPAQDNLLNIFDSIFKTSSNTSKPETNKDSTSRFDFLKPCQQVEARSRTPSSQKRERLKIFGKKPPPKDFQAILPSDLIENIPQVQQKDRFIDSPVAQNRSINFSMIEKRGSGQFNENNLQFSTEQIQLKNILQSEIFVNQPAKKPVQGLQKIKKIPTLQIPQQLAIQNPLKTPKSEQPKAQINLPILIQSPIQLMNSGILEESKVIRSDTSIVSISPALHGYIDNGNGFQPQNSMANLTSPLMFDLSMRGSQANDLRLGKFGKNPLYESQVIEVKPIIVRINLFDSQKRIPIFLREIRKHVSVYPNFYLLSNPHTTQSIQQQFIQLLNLFTEAITTLNSYCQKVLDLKAKKKIYLNELTNSLTVDFFVESGWEKIVDISQFNEIKPIQPFQARQWSFQKAKMALANYQNIVQYYKNKGVVIDVSSDKGKKKYFQIRQKFWDICGNMKLISEDIYTQMIDCLMPQHFYRLQKFLKQQFPSRIDEKSTYQVKQIACLYKTLTMENDILIASDIGIKLKEKIDDHMKYLNPY